MNLNRPDKSFTKEHLPEIPQRLRILPLDGVLFPFALYPIQVSNENIKNMIEEVVSEERIIGVFTEKGGYKKETNSPDIYQTGTAALVVRMLRMPDGSLQVMLQGLRRITVKETVQTQPFIMADVELMEEDFEQTVEFEGLLKNTLKQFQEIIQLAPYISEEASIVLRNLDNPSQQIDFISSQLNLNKEDQQKILETSDINERLNLIVSHLNHELEVLQIGSKIQQDMQQQMSKVQRQAYLRQQLEAIKKELGEGDEQTAEINEFREQLEKKDLPEEVRKEADREMDRMSKIPPASPEYIVSRNYLDWIINLPWNESTEDYLDIDQAQQILDNDHFDLEKPKERIVDYLSVRKLKQDMKGPILCFVGPPGTGKTSLGRSIGSAMGRNFIRMSLGGIRDEAEIRGHRRTYIGSLPGRIIQNLRRAESNNPVMMLDEIDKVGADYRGDPSSALLEVLDPEQNSTFVDHYLDVAFDLSKVLFIATANTTATIPPPLLDRMEIIELHGYTEHDKVEIAVRYLVPKQTREHGLKESDVNFDRESIMKIIRDYTREAGLRNLERGIATVCRKSARYIADGDTPPIHITKEKVREILGPERHRYEKMEKEDEIGLAVGLAWTAAGGDILFIESSVVPGTGQLRLTGQLGDVMRESGEAAMTYVRSRAKQLELSEDFHKKWDAHIHVPVGAIPKDGPSAGITMTTALVSAFTKVPVRKNVAMTGEITLRGKVLPVGGIRDKVLAAHRAEITTVILPKDNDRDLEDVPDIVKENVTFEFVEHMDEVLKIALTPSKEKSTRKKQEVEEEVLAKPFDS